MLKLPTFLSSPRLKTWLYIVGEFVAGQTMTNLVASLTGFLLIRWLTKQAFAEYSFAFTVQTTIVAITDAGFGGAMVGLIGERANEPEVVGKYIAAVVWFRTRIFLFTSVLAIIFIPLLLRNQPWSLMSKISIIASVIFTSYVRGWTVAQVALVIQKKLNIVYRPQLGINIGRLALSGLLHILSSLTGQLSIWINAISGAIYNYIIGHEGEKLAIIPKESDPETRAEVLRYIYPLAFNVLYNAFQPQISQFLITYFGKTEGMADLFALGRLGFIFPILSSVSWFILEPYCAKLPKAQLKTKYPQLLFVAALPLLVLVVLAYLRSDLFVLVLGAKYSNLRSEVPLAMLGGALGCLAGTMWTLCMSRRWMFWWYSVVTIVVNVAAQIICISLLNISTIHGVVLFGFYTAATSLLINVLATIYFLYFMPTPAAESTSLPSQEDL